MTFVAGLPSGSSGTVNFLDGGTTLGSGSVSTSNVSALQLDGADDGVSTNLALDPAACPDMTLAGCKSTVRPTRPGLVYQRGGLFQRRGRRLLAGLRL